jgi:omega-6 fatty acid desaturase (delta-12 desaturase)
MTLLQSLKSVRLVLWDEERLQLVSFAEARARSTPHLSAIADYRSL